ncbi:TIM barrel protein (plasmid) [Sinorhizobium meliloti WSM1022]|uniref:sugar phosphate isomerase/epimerase family protein n=1 Tax=Sinorhizobium TaxID=28105 RepID=UPI0003F5DC78|nr:MULTISPECIES: TIM barrel protein [Sinorhizobium]MDE3831385.1 TIM barrel protein [Sinorhizobium meliloti]MDE4579068.1 sugar phosphate isomerase/epimerase [Sinorhizobium meliloti]MDW9627768.1 TIM barrel protein [Sinorhizobium meliloti]MDW9714062.1 TIM barrel protein [Sinorhizobium meliloti]MDW9751185.1 TIM barrel protein [Sinorhizobium meliloti]
MKTANVSLAHLGVSDQGPRALIAAAAGAGFGGVGLPLLSGALKPMRTEIVGNAALIDEIVALCRDTGIRIFDVESLVLGHLPDDDHLHRVFETAAVLGASRISCLGYEKTRGPGTLKPGEAGEELARLAKLAAGFGLMVCVEFMGFRSIDSLASAASIVRASGAPNAAVILDALHVQRTGATIDEIAALPAGTVSHFQICDASALSPPPEQLVDEARSGRLLPGEGIIPLAAIIAALPAGTDMSLEIPVAALSGLPVAERARIGAASISWL